MVQYRWKVPAVLNGPIVWLSLPWNCWLTVGAPLSVIGLAVPFTQEPFMILCVTAASSIRFRLLPLLIVTDDCTKFVLPIWTSVLPPPELPHATATTVIRLSTTRPAKSFFIVFA